MLNELDRDGGILNSLGRACLTEKARLEILAGGENVSPGKSGKWKSVPGRENNQCMDPRSVCACHVPGVAQRPLWLESSWKNERSE